MFKTLPAFLKQERRVKSEVHKVYTQGTEQGLKYSVILYNTRTHSMGGDLRC